jgi:chromosome segregation ATPase
MGPTDLTVDILISIREEIRGTNTRLDETITRLDGHERVLVRMEREIGRLNETQIETNARLDGVSERLDGVSERLDGVIVRLDGHDRAQNVVGQRLSGIQDQLGTLVDIVKRIDDDEIGDLRRRVEALEAKVG